MTDTQRFDQVAATWDEDTNRTRLASAVAEAIAAAVGLTPALDVLDYGCGTGLLTLALRPHVRSVAGVDTSAGMLAVLDRKVRDGGLTGVVTARLGAGTGYAFTGAYDLIVSSMTLHHVADVGALLDRLHRHLRPGGRVALADLDLEDGTFHKPEITDVHHPGFDRGALKARLADAGFVDLADTTAFVHRRNDRDYPVFLVTGRRSD